MKKEFLCLKIFPKKILLVCFCLSLACLFSIFALGLPTSALGIKKSQTINLNPTNSRVYYNAGNQTGLNNAFSLVNGHYDSNLANTANTYGRVTRLSLNNFTPAADDLPAIISFTVSYIADATENPFVFTSASLANTSASGVSVLNYSCETITRPSDGNPSITIHILVCDVSVYMERRVSPLDIYQDVSFSNPSSNVTIAISRANAFTINYDSLSDNDKDWMSDDFISALQQAEADAQKEANEDIKDQTETQTQSSESTANTQGGDSEQTGTTLLQAFSGFVSAITNVSPAQSCDFDLDFSGYNPDLTATVDMCSISPPAGLTFIGSIILILFCVPLSISTVRRMIGLFRSFQT